MHDAFHDLAQAPQPSCRVRLLCLAGSQANLEQYRAWAYALNDPVEVIAVDIQRFGTHAEPSALAGILAEQLHPYLAGAHAIFGQGEGALIAFELARLAEHQYPGHTRHLFVSACDSPRVAEPFASERAIRLPVTVLYAPGLMARMLGWHAFVRRELELIELPDPELDKSTQDQRFVRIFNSHLSLSTF